MQSLHLISPSSADCQPGFTTGKTSFTLRQLAELSQVTENDLIELTRYGVLSPIDPGVEPLSFSKECVAVSRRAGRLREELALDEHAFALAVMFFHKLVGLEADISALQVELRYKREVVPVD